MRHENDLILILEYLIKKMNYCITITIFIKQSLKFEKHQKSLKFEYCKLRKLMSKNLKLVVERVVGYQFNSRKNYDINFVLKRLKFILS